MELNDKLARWAGFIPSVAVQLQNGELAYAWAPPIGNIGNIILEMKPPNFTESLDQCFKWLVPKLEEKYEITLRYNARLHPDEGNPWYCCLFAQEAPFKDAQLEAETPSLALCLAIDKLIGGENE